jgi:nucleoside-diphosphate-sugar epimerase
MLISIIGTNGLLSTCIGSYCNKEFYKLNMYGKTEPKLHKYTNFSSINFLDEELDYEELIKSDLIIYTAGAGIQYHLQEDVYSIYHLNVSVPVLISNHLKARDYKGTFITFGSYFEIGETSNNTSFNELDLVQSQLFVPNDYAISKRMLTRFFSSFRSSFTFLHFILPTLYGENESTYRLIPYTLKSIEANVKLKLTSGDQIRQYIYIQDVVHILFSSVKERLSSGIYNIAGVEEFSVKELVSMLFKIKGKKMPENIFGQADRVDMGMKVLRLNGDKLNKYLNNMPKTKIREIYKRYNFE